MGTPPLPLDHHVLRYVRKRLLRRDEDDNPIGVLPHAFQRRPGEGYLSVTWIQHFSSDYEAGFRSSVNAMRSQLTVKPADGFTCGQVGSITTICSGRNCRVRILHEPEESNSGHSAWRGLDDNDMELLGQLADDAFVDTRLSASL
jgi:hypothetical protein